MQSIHAVDQMRCTYGPDDYISNVVFVGVPNTRSLEKVLKKLKDNQIPHYPWHEPDGDMGFTSIATAPLNSEQKSVLCNYRLWKFTPEKQSQGLLGGSVLTPAPVYPVAQRLEQ